MTKTTKQPTQPAESAFVTYLQSTELCLLPPMLDPQSGQSLSTVGITPQTVRFYRIDELSAEEEGDLQLAMENVIAGLTNASYRWIYYLVGKATGVELYLGVMQAKKPGGRPRAWDIVDRLVQGQLYGGAANQAQQR